MPNIDNNWSTSHDNCTEIINKQTQFSNMSPKQLFHLNVGKYRVIFYQKKYSFEIKICLLRNGNACILVVAAISVKYSHSPVNGQPYLNQINPGKKHYIKSSVLFQIRSH